MKIYNIYFSPNQNTKQIAMYFSNHLQSVDINLNKKENRENLNIEMESLTILSIPTFSQNIPVPLRPILYKIKSKYVLLNITYGGFSYGNMIYETAKKLKNSIIIGYSITPVNHSYINQNIPIDFSKYDILISRIRNQYYKPAKIKFKFNNIFANFLEKYRTIFNYKINLDDSLCTHCNLCISNCPVQAINTRIEINDACIKCAKCVNICPVKALSGKKSFFLKIYLKKKQKTSVIIR